MALERAKEKKAMAKAEKNILNKDDILNGKKKRETVYLEAYDKNVVIRPLTDGELSRVFSVIGNVPLNRNGVPDLNLVDISTNLKALRMITSMAMVEPEMTEEEVGEMRFGVPGILAKEILKLSGLTSMAGEAAKKFRTNA